MVSIETLILIFYPLGMWLTIPLLPWHITLLDIFVVALVMLSWRTFFQKKYYYFWIFIGTLLLSWLWRLCQPLHLFSIGALLYLGRTGLYYAFLAYFVNESVGAINKKWLLFWLTGWLVVLGLGQYVLAPNFLSWQVLGWDPHLGRLVGNWYDPGFLATAYLLLLVFWSYFSKSLVLLGLWLITWIALLLTYARSIWLLALGWLLSKRERFTWWLILFLGMAFLALPSNVSEGTRIWRTASTKERWQNSMVAWRVFRQHPFLGIGFNNLASWRSRQGINLGHANRGFENSFFFVLATSGLVGFLGYLIFLWHLLSTVPPRGKSLVILWLLSGLFNNSLFYPFLIILLAVLLAALRDGR